MRQVSIVIAAFALVGCTVHGTVPGQVAVGTPGVVVEPTVHVWSWWPYPHYEARRCAGDCEREYAERHDHGKHKGWYKHRDHDDDD